VEGHYTLPNPHKLREVKGDFGWLIHCSPKQQESPFEKELRLEEDKAPTPVTTRPDNLTHPSSMGLLTHLLIRVKWR
jgi:hypothetical protein